MKCEKCQSENIIATEEQGNYYAKRKNIPKTSIIIITLLAILINIVNYTIQRIVFVTPITIGLVILDVIIIVVAISNSIWNNEQFNKKWIKTSRTKFTCMDCGKQWYANEENEEFTQKY